MSMACLDGVVFEITLGDLDGDCALWEMAFRLCGLQCQEETDAVLIGTFNSLMVEGGDADLSRWTKVIERVVRLRLGTTTWAH